MNEPLGIVIKAIHFASQKHRNQRRKDRNRTPYINHPVSVAAILSVHGEVEDPDILAAALLHDTLEDTETTFAELSSEFSESIAYIVSEVTDDKHLPKHIRKQKHIENASSLSYAARLIRIADKINNLQDITHSPPVWWSKKDLRLYTEWAQEVVNQIRGTHSVLEELFDKTVLQANRKT